LIEVVNKHHKLSRSGFKISTVNIDMCKKPRIHVWLMEVKYVLGCDTIALVFSKSVFYEEVEGGKKGKYDSNRSRTSRLHPRINDLLYRKRVLLGF